ncbi:BnaA03g60590D [Brassica napus]|uniref:BnaA03g60590D protein n=1 Tax=Brassica napus TaxID=3708 RepID=A0A078H6C4_BRANA|nr:BnaA03g60590D [Brassica napus]
MEVSSVMYRRIYGGKERPKS